jgi:Fe-S-cluster containining protein
MTTMTDEQYQHLLKEMNETKNKAAKYARKFTEALEKSDTKTLRGFGFEVLPTGNIAVPECLAVFADNSQRAKQTMLLGHAISVYKWLRSKPEHTALAFIWRFIDDSAEGQTFSCKRGCAGCCYQPVLTFEAEAKLIRKLLATEPHRVIDPAKLVLHGAMSMEYHASKITRPERRCAFLQDNNDCSIYDVRPIACRNHRSVDPPEKCFDVDGTEVHYMNLFGNACLIFAAHALWPSATLAQALTGKPKG